MISGAHIVLHTKEPEADRFFFRDVLGFKSVDAGRGWLIFALPPAEAAFRPAAENGGHELFFMCDDLKPTEAPDGIGQTLGVDPVQNARSLASPARPF